VARSEQLEAILRAQYELEYADPEELASRLDHQNALLDKSIAGTSLTRRELSRHCVIAITTTNERNCSLKPGGVRSNDAHFVEPAGGANRRWETVSGAERWGA
jgi:hypothetical protein